MHRANSVLDYLVTKVVKPERLEAVVSLVENRRVMTFVAGAFNLVTAATPPASNPRTSTPPAETPFANTPPAANPPRPSSPPKIDNPNKNLDSVKGKGNGSETGDLGDSAGNMGRDD
jgi:hypothetical protein